VFNQPPPLGAALLNRETLMSITTIKINRELARGLEWVLGEGSIHISEDLSEDRNGFDWTEDQVVELGDAITDICNCLHNEKHFKVTISKK
jgi:hypothetical protein